MLTRDHYIAVLEKRAAEGFPVPHSNDSAQTALEEVQDNMGDNRSELKGLFSNASAQQTQASKELNKLFPSGKRETAAPLLKLAARRALTETALLKEASPQYMEVAFRSFERELEKIAVLQGQTLPQLQYKNMVAAEHPHVYDVSHMMGGGAAQEASHGLAPAVQAMRARKAAGFLGRFFH